MACELEWNGFATQSASGVLEALYVAGVDCSVHEHGGDELTMNDADCSND